MRTPAGKECRHYYQDFHRGRNVQECRLVQGNTESLPWRPQACHGCPVPDILAANASARMALTLTIRPRLLGLGRRHEVEAFCTRHRHPIPDPYVGCADCNAERPGLNAFLEALTTPPDATPD